MDKGAEILEKYRSAEKVEQVMLCQYLGESRAEFELWLKGGNGIWHKALRCPAFVGRAGVGRAAENDSKTPLGDFGMVSAFGIKPDPGAKLSYIHVDEHTWCCGDEVAYNRIIDLREHPHNCRGEHLIDFAPEYNYGIFFDYNPEGRVGLGFAIFLHCMGDKPYTGGCIAVDEDSMRKILCSVDEHARLCIFEKAEL